MAKRKKKLLTVWLIALLCAFSAHIALAEPDQPQALKYTGIYQLKDIDPNLTGRGVNFALICRSVTYTDGQPQNDYQPNIDHNCFTTSRFTFHDQDQITPGISAHSTAICSILFGRDPNVSASGFGTFNYNGIIPDANAHIYEFWHFLTNNIFPAIPPQADIITASFGNSFEDWWTRGIESIAQHHGITIVAAIGNGSENSNSLLYPAAGSNIIGVGVVDSVDTNDLAIKLANFALPRSLHSSTGPTNDDRSKPDIVAPANCLVADHNNLTGYRPAGDWSSFSTPLVAGSAALLIQKINIEPDLNAAVTSQNRNSLIKAILLNSATKLPYWHKGYLEKDDDHSYPLDRVQGAGMLNAKNAYHQLTAGPQKPGNCPKTGWDSNYLKNHETEENSYQITIEEPADKFITITAAWNKHFENFYPFEPQPQKNANLQLEIWAVDPNNPDNDYMLDYSDSPSDNLEHIYRKADANFTNYEIIISISPSDDPAKIPDGKLPYAIAWNVSSMPASSPHDFYLYDLNTDGIVDENDFKILIANWQATSEPTQAYLLGDINNDGSINLDDLDILFNQKTQKANWLKNK